MKVASGLTLGTKHRVQTSVQGCHAGRPISATPLLRTGAHRKKLAAAASAITARTPCSAGIETAGIGLGTKRSRVSRRGLKAFAVAEPDEKENTSSEGKEAPAAASANGNGNGAPPAAPKKKVAPKKKKEKKEPWPLSRNTNPVSTTGKTHYNIIKRSQWPTGVPSVMGGHLMPSGEVAPVTTSPAPIADIYDKTMTQYVHPFHYYSTERMDETREESQVEVFDTRANLASTLCQRVGSKARETIGGTGKFTLVLSGGSLISMLEGLKQEEGVDWTKVHVFWVDERLCDLTHEDSSAGAAKRVFLDALGLPEENHHVIDGSLTVDQAARAYEGRMLQLSQEVLPRNEDNLPVMDLMLLGMGPDGHVASLFPNRKELAENPAQWILPVSQSPKPPSERITMTMDVINAAREVCLVACGSGKAEIVQRALEHQTLPGALPAQLVRPKQGRLIWALDADAAKDITPSTWEDKKAWPRNKIA